MQFTDISELRSIVGMMRSQAQSSAKFHDRHDSEVDRLYNSSPEASGEAENFLGENGKEQNARNISHIIGSNTKSTSDNTKEEKSSGSNNTRGGGKGCKIVYFDAKKDKLKNGEVEEYYFERETIPSLSELSNSSELAKILKGAGDVGSKLPTHGIDSAMLQLAVYLPNRDEMSIELYEISTVEESIETILRTHRAESRLPALYYGHPECYELRLHDQDGLPDEDFPALDRSRKIANFGDAGNHEYCLCERPDACPPVEESKIPKNRIPSNKTSGGTNRVRTISQNAGTSPSTTPRGQAFLKIYLPNDDYTVLAIDSTTTGKDLLPQLQKKHRLQMLADELVFKLSINDRDRLKVQNEIVDMHTKLFPLGVQELTLGTRQYADAPQVAMRGNDTEEQAPLPNARPHPETFMYNDVTVSMYKEWEVIKKNKYGKKQHRMLGIDLHKIYNNKVGERAIKSKTLNAERQISMVRSIEFLDHPCEFVISFTEPDAVTIEYAAATPYECAEIVAKIKYIVSRKLSKE